MFAMKVLKKASLKLRDRVRTKVERDILAAVRHPFIVRLEYAFQTEGRLYLILEYLRGGDLFSRLSKEVVLPESDARFYMAELALALNHVHQLGIIYRDLKPENILLDTEGHVKLTDFGLSKEAVSTESGGRAFSFCGTIEYMAPEVITRRGHDSTADWWSLGVLMYEMLCGLLPFQGDSRRDTMQQILRAKLRMPQFLSLEAQSLLRALFKRNPTNRLGYGQNGFRDLQAHPFFNQISWDRLLQRNMPAPFIPTCPPDPTTDVTYSVSCSSFVESPDISANSATWDTFSGFSYAAPDSPIPPGNRSENGSATLKYHNEAGMDNKKDSPREYGGITTVHFNAVFERDRRQSVTISPSTYLATEKDSAGVVNARRKTSVNLNGVLDATSTDPTYKSLELFTQEYELREVIEQNIHIVQRRCVHRHTYEVRTVKMVDRRHYDPTEEIKILGNLRQVKHVITLFDVYISETHIYLVTDYAPGGRLSDRILRKGRLSEFEACCIVEILATTLQVLHENGVIHGNLNASSVVYSGLDQNPSSMLITDFAMVKFRKNSGAEIHGNSAGQDPHFNAPGAADDIRGLGLILRDMLLGRALHAHGIFASTQVDVNNSTDIKHSPRFQSPSASAQNLVQQMVHPNRLKRFTAENVLKHAWILNRHDLPREIHSSVSHNSLDSQSLGKFLRYSNAMISPPFPILEPVTASRIAARRRQTRVGSIPRTVVIRPPIKYATINAIPPIFSSSSSCVSSITLPRIHLPDQVYTELPRSADPWTSAQTDERYFSSTTFVLNNNETRKKFYTSNQSDMAGQHRVPV
ncbi:p90 ribosomal S6 kinase [Clonorchis sinensis]|uniref:p90 ribosomal S6 kinase n=3 Tax=Clonorchis sinensis TaxID=79923 RepID=G7YBK5_CLOSI|nr:p90 ribosomal S6 kinase [Clonorchis sinensis]